MKPTIFFLILTLLLIPTRSAMAKASPEQAIITLTADQVTSAIDIENAMHQVTAEGTRPGMVVLDGRKGAFVFSGIDRAINIFFSNLTLRGVNNAALPNTDGIYIDHVPADNLVIEGLAMRCSGDCVGMVGIHNQVTIRDNLFQAGGMGIGVAYGKDWCISGNTIQAQNFAIFLIFTERAVVTQNHLGGSIGIVVEGASLSKIQRNTISSGWQGILLNGEAYKNQVIDNSMLGIQQAGVSLEPGVSENRIYKNRVVCALAASCLTVDASPESIKLNHITGNRP